MIDAAAIEIALRRYGLPECLHVPIAAMDEQAISNFVGEIVQDLSGRSARRALLVRAGDPPPRDLSLPIWDVSGCDILHQRMQVWVDVKYGSYRSAYKKAFPGTNIANFVLSHAMNRRVATLRRSARRCSGRCRRKRPCSMFIRTAGMGGQDLAESTFERMPSSFPTS